MTPNVMTTAKAKGGTRLNQNFRSIFTDCSFSFFQMRSKCIGQELFIHYHKYEEKHLIRDASLLWWIS